MSIIKNLCPHPVVMLDENGEIKKAYPSVGLCRVSTSQEIAFYVTDEDGDTFPRYDVVYGDVDGLPEWAEDVYYIVSGVVRSALPNRTDLLSPNSTLMKREGGIPVGTPAFQ